MQSIYGINATFITVGLSIIGLEISPATLSSILCTSQVDSLIVILQSISDVTDSADCVSRTVLMHACTVTHAC